jgi:GntR family L-lactate dehydrogenase operon transcriptional regulator
MSKLVHVAYAQLDGEAHQMAQAPEKVRSSRTEQIERSDEAEYIALRELQTNPAPVGCWRIKAVLHEAGIEMSEATAGRLLKEFDSRGLTSVVGAKGRILTEEGERRADNLETLRRRWAYQDELMEAIRAEKIKDIEDLLVARRAVEVETARLAAIHATDADIEQIKAAVQALKNYWLGVGGERNQNPLIHKFIAKASGNRVFDALVNLLYENNELARTLWTIQRVMKALDPEEHDEILAAIAAHEPEQAAAAMRTHFDRLLEVVKRYGETHAEPQTAIHVNATLTV